MVKVIEIGASGTIGKEVAINLGKGGNEVIRASRKSGDFHADIRNKQRMIIFKYQNIMYVYIVF